MSKKGSSTVLAIGIVAMVIGIASILALAGTSALAYPPDEWEDGPPDPVPFVLIVSELICSTCCLFGPVVTLAGLVMMLLSSKKRKGK